MKHKHFLLVALSLLFCFANHWALATVLTNVVLGNPPAQNGSFSYDTSNDTYTVSGTGQLLYADSAGFGDLAYTAITGNFDVSAQITSYSGSGWAGLMALNGLSSQDAFAASLLSLADPYGPGYSYAQTYDGTVFSGTTASASSPWLRLTRIGDTLTEYTSTNGSTWTFTNSQSIPMASSVNVGLFVNSADQTTVDSATFANVSGFPAPVPAPDSLALMILAVLALGIIRRNSESLPRL